MSLVRESQAEYTMDSMFTYYNYSCFVFITEKTAPGICVS